VLPIQVSDSSWNFLACLPYIKFHLLDRCSPQAYYSLPDKCRQRLLIRHLSDSAGFQGNYPSGSFDSNALGCERFIRAAIPLHSLLGKFQKIEHVTRSEELRKCIFMLLIPVSEPCNQHLPECFKRCLRPSGDHAICRLQ